MPVVAIPTDDLNQRLGTTLSTQELELFLEQLGCDIEEFTKIKRIQCNMCGSLQELTLQEDLPTKCPECHHENTSDVLWSQLDDIDVVRMDLLPVRPDIFDPGGLTRALKGLLNLQTGLPSYPLLPPKESVTIDPSVQNKDSCRPFIACAIVRGLSLDDIHLRLLMKLQENLHWALGRDRKLASIGMYDLSGIKGPFLYTTSAPNDLSFVPLHPQKSEPQTLQTILQNHPKGVAYKHLLDGFERFPILLDSQKQVLSMPPIINAHQSRVTTETTDVLIDVTGITEKAVEKTLHTLVTSLLEIFPDAQAEQINLHFTNKETQSPSLTTESFSFNIQAATRLIGISLTTKKAISLLEQMRHQATPTEDTNILNVTVAAYRNDLMHEVDLMEDLAIAYGYQNIERSLVPTMTVAKERPERVLANRTRNILTGLGFFEAMSLILSNAEEQYDLMNLPDPNHAVLLAHPASVEQTMLRTMLMPQLLNLFAINRGQGLPQKFFEVDDIVLHKGEEHPQERLHLVAGILDSEVGFADLKSLSEAIAFELGIKFTYQAISHPTMIPGRGAQIEYNGNSIGFMGEIHPMILEKLRITQPIVALEIDLTPFYPNP